jgi:hypothetical protein
MLSICCQNHHSCMPILRSAILRKRNGKSWRHNTKKSQSKF